MVLCRGVSGDQSLNDIPFGTPGARRLVCLSDGSTLEEQVLEQERNQTSSRFRYIVWNYTTQQARPIEYGIGEFHHTEMPGGRTHIVWTYSFKLKDHEFPGYLGALGRYLFRIGLIARLNRILTQRAGGTSWSRPSLNTAIVSG